MKRQLTSTIEEVTSTIERVTTAIKAKESTSTTTINDLPDELLSLILSKLSLEDKLRYECVCKLWQKVIYEHVKKAKFYDNHFNKRNRFDYKHWCGDYEHKMDKNDLVEIKLLS